MPRRKTKSLVRRKRSKTMKRRKRSRKQKRSKTMKLRRKRSRKYRRKQKGGEEKGMVRGFIEGSGNSGNAPDAKRRAQIARDRKAYEEQYGKPKQEKYNANDAANDSSESIP